VEWGTRWKASGRLGGAQFLSSFASGGRLAAAILVAAGASAKAQDPSMIATQQAVQASQQAMQNAQQANQQATLAAQQQQVMQNAQCNRCGEAAPKFSVKSGTYSSILTVTISDKHRQAAIYYTTDGWTPTTASNRYAAPITVDSSATVRAIAISPYGGRSRVTSAVYTLNGVAPAATGAQSIREAPKSGGDVSSEGKLLLVKGTAVPLTFTADVSSRTAMVGEKIPLALAEDLKAGGEVVVRKGTPATALVTEVDTPHVMGLPGEVSFQVDSLKVGDVVVRLRGGAAKEGPDKEAKAAALFLVPIVPGGLFVRGKDATIRQGSIFTASVDVDALLPASN
jgi:Tfp pilus assembly protein PilV